MITTNDLIDEGFAARVQCEKHELYDLAITVQRLTLRMAELYDLLAESEARFGHLKT